jgi:hypothetical protein
MTTKQILALFITLVLIMTLFGAPSAAAAPEESTQPAFRAIRGRFSSPVAFDASPALRELAARHRPGRLPANEEIRPDRGPVSADQGHALDGALQQTAPSLEIAGPVANFEGLSNQDNFNVFGFRVNPPDPVGDVGPNHYVEMVNIVFAVYSKTGTRLLGPLDIGTLWDGFAIEDCTDPSGDPIVVYDQLADRWLLSQFTTRGLDDPSLPFYNCVAISQTGDPTGAYYRYAFTTGSNFPDYPKYGVWTHSYVITTREFGPTGEYGIGVYGLEKNRMLQGDPNARAVSFFLDGNARGMLPLVGDGLLPADIDGRQKPTGDALIPIVGTQDDEGPYRAAFDALNIWELDVKWRSAPTGSITLKTQIPVAEFDSMFPCAPTSRDCLPQPGANPNQQLDILSYRQRPTWRLAYRSFGTYESLVTNQSVEALPGVAGVRWYELRRTGTTYSLNQQGTYAPADGVHRWMGSAAQDKIGNIALGYSVVNGVDVYPGIRYTGRLAGDPLGQMTLGEGVIVNGSGVQTTHNSRWGDYTSLNVDPVDDCTFWYVNEYYAVSGTPADGRPWQTRIASFKLPGC